MLKRDRLSAESWRQQQAQCQCRQVGRVTEAVAASVPRWTSRGDSKENPEMESTYEPIDPAISLNGKEVELLPADCSPACWKPAFTCRAAMVTVALVLATSVSLNVLLLALGLVHYSKMVATLEQAHQENRQLQEAACNPFSMDWTFFQGSYYFFSYSPGTWDVANQSCTSMGFHLVMINSIEEKGHVATIMKAPSCWIGLTDQVLEDDWKWVDGTHIEHGDRNLGRSHNSGTPEKHHNSEQLPNELNYWHQNEPNGGKGENCASMQNSLWYDHECKEKFHWICERRF
ncbi:CD209 antigen-like protein D isoform X5 [Pantherophis guttatus]|uniref:CD209 antigen-like protein D isoform X5 n=1 Tax=Pantherophis guttatus TaxID=94885 RepID=A0ABM3YTG6_PANGU|nr:CD209 antigen-like protein D isoform X5 [Pantherophis guttatus]